MLSCSCAYCCTECGELASELLRSTFAQFSVYGVLICVAY